MILSVPHECKLIERQVAWTSAWLRHWICRKNRPPSRFDNGPEFNSPKFSKKAINCLFHIGRLTLLSWFHALPLYSASQASVVTKCIEQYGPFSHSSHVGSRKTKLLVFPNSSSFSNISSWGSGTKYIVYGKYGCGPKRRQKPCKTWDLFFQDFQAGTLCITILQHLQISVDWDQG